MSSSGSDSDSCMTRATSTPMLHMTAPENINYYIKFKSIEKSKKKKFIYTLKMGQKLPYEPEIEGCILKYIYLCLALANFRIQDQVQHGLEAFCW